jgi:hypothetical protein
MYAELDTPNEWCCIQGVHGTKTTQHALALDYVTMAGVLDRLQANIQEDHQLTCGFLYATWKRVSVYILCRPTRHAIASHHACKTLCWHDVNAVTESGFARTPKE